MSLWKEALLGASDYFTVNKLIVVCFAIILYEIFVHQKLSGFLKYVAGVIILILFPVTAVVFLIYLPGVYEYGFLWNLIPIVAVCAYAGVRFLWDMISGVEHRGKSKYVAGILAVVGVLFLLGNRGRMQKVTLDEAEQRSAYGQVAESLSDETVLWGPRELMQWVRSRNPEVKLVYGLDMWDAQAAAYDGDAYEADLAAAYEWMQELEEFTYQLEITTDVVLPIPDDIVAKLPDALEAVKRGGANVIVLPRIAYQRIAERIPSEYQVEEVADYTLLCRSCK